MFNLRRTKDEAKVEAPLPPLFSAAATKETRRDAAWLAARIARSKLFKPGEMETETVEVSPALAELMLEHNTHNRPVTNARVERFAAALERGAWRLTPQGVSFDRNGALSDGQHRLMAIIRAGISTRCRVTFGDDPENFAVLDTGGARGGGDALAIAGYKWWNVLAAGARAYANITSPNPLSNASIPNDQLLDIVQAHPILADVCTEAALIAKKLHSPVAPLVAGFALIRAAKSTTNERYNEFIERLTTGADLGSRSPILTLREMFNAGAFSGPNSANKSSRICAAVVQCWNRWTANRTATIKALRWDGTTPFPAVE